MPTSRLLIAGASGFIGRELTRLAAERGIAALGVSRHGGTCAERSVSFARVSRYENREELARLAAGCQTAIILAGRAHVTNDREADPAAAFFKANRDLPVAMAEALASAAVHRILFVSSLAVYGSRATGQVIRDGDPPAPETDYGRSKWAGEQALAERCAALGVELVIVRPPMVYGAEAPGYFGQLLRAAWRGLPLPLGAVNNRRSVIGVSNLADLLLHAVSHPAASGQSFLVSDERDVSTAEMAATLYAAAGHSRRLFRVPPALLRAGLAALGQKKTAARLLDDLRIDSGRVRAMLDWRPPIPTSEGLRRCLRGPAQ